jgi:hypothetical protein
MSSVAGSVWKLSYLKKIFFLALVIVPVSRQYLVEVYCLFIQMYTFV